MKERRVEEFKAACREYLDTVSLHLLRILGRSLQMKKPTAMKKGALIEEILGILSGEISPQRDKKGAPIKYDHLDKKIIEKIHALKAEYFGEEQPTLSQPIENEEKTAKEPKETNEKEVKYSSCVQLVLNIADLNNEQQDCLKAFLSSLVITP